MPKNERTFQAEIRQSLKMLNGTKFYWKIPDAGFRNHFDALLVWNGKPIAFEYKITKHKTSIPISSLFYGREHELQALSRFNQAGGYSFILINVFEAFKRNEVYVFTYRGWRDCKEYISPKKSIKFDDPEIESFAIKLEKNKYGFWPLNKLFI